MEPLQFSVCVHKCVCVCISVYVSKKCVCVCDCSGRVSSEVCIRAWVCVWVWMCVCMWMCVCVHVCVWMCVCVYDLPDYLVSRAEEEEGKVVGVEETSDSRARTSLAPPAFWRLTDTRSVIACQRWCYVIVNDVLVCMCVRSVSYGTINKGDNRTAHTCTPAHTHVQIFTHTTHTRINNLTRDRKSVV